MNLQKEVLQNEIALPYTVKLQLFEGPLDVLLNLIEDKKLEITQISLADVTNQFVQYIERSPIPPGLVADFIAVAARLLLIKTKALLPFLVLSEEEEEELVDLEARLRLLQQFRESGKGLRRMVQKKHVSFGRETVSFISVTFYPPENVTQEVLHHAFKRIADEFHAFFEKQKYATATLEKVVSLEERIRDLMKIIEVALEKRFHEVTHDAKSKMDIIIMFLAMLELIKQRLIAVEQQGLFGEITIRKSN